MRIIYFGTGAFALPALHALKDYISLVVTQPDRPSGRGLRLQPSPAKLLAVQLGIPVEAPERSRAPDFVDRLRSESADALLVASYGQILSQAVLDSAKRGGINLHGSILPKYRGAAPIQRCLLEGESETGISLMQMDKGMDTGDVIQISRLAIDPDETYTQLQGRLAQLAAEMAIEWLPRIVAGDYPRVAQDGSLATSAPKIDKDEARLDFDRPASQEYDRFRAFTESPGAFLQTRLGALRIHQARLCPGEGIPGEVLSQKAALTVAFQQGGIDLIEIQLEGKKRMAGRDFANGARLRPGDSLKK